MEEQTAVLFSLSPKEAESISNGTSRKIQLQKKPKLETPFLGFGFVQVGRFVDKKRTIPQEPAWLTDKGIRTSLDRSIGAISLVNGLVALQFLCKKVSYSEEAVLYTVEIDEVKTMHFPRDLNTFHRELPSQCSYSSKCSFLSCDKYPCQKAKMKPPAPYCYVRELVKGNDEV